MERIQTAIDKARKARTLQQGGTAAVLPTKKAKDALPLPKEVPRHDDADGWSALTRFDPKQKFLEQKRIVAYQSGREALPFDVLRTRLLHEMRANKWRRVAITSPNAGAGKTMTCVNLAFSLARQQDHRTMLIEMDMRRPSMAGVLGVKGTQQFSDALSGRSPVEDHMVRYGQNLAFALNQTTARNPAELLQGAAAAQVIDNIDANYQPDIMIFDLPPVFASDDAMGFMDQVDCALLIGEAEKTTIDEIDKCEQELAARTNVLGVILNKCRYLGSHEGDGNQYGY
ncbi:MAG: CpsD/CapB family tyrosine-protein kinase [Paracoccaceae bacterium]